MKGQYHVVMEMLILSMGILIVSFVLVAFNIVETGIDKASISDQLSGIAHHIKNAIMDVMSADTKKASITLEIPIKVSDEEYVIETKTDSGKNMLKLYLFSNPNIGITEELFNTGSQYTIKQNQLLSSAKYIKIELELIGTTKTIKLGR